ncbi:MAG: type II toxin-antitoxin system PemK/MazF family toxin [Deltaproteobacteria bacterium]|nr:type II toxin-antitoxin system PemK/MazF family toxin [Deltaproteobacteria bacterium]
MPKVMVNQTRAVDKVRLVKRLGQLPEKIMAEVDRALKLHYDLDWYGTLHNRNAI